MSASTPITERRYVVPLVLVTSLFFLWAIGVNLNDILIQHFKKRFAEYEEEKWMDEAYVKRLEEAEADGNNYWGD